MVPVTASLFWVRCKEKLPPGFKEPFQEPSSVATGVTLVTTTEPLVTTVVAEGELLESLPPHPLLNPATKPNTAEYHHLFHAFLHLTVCPQTVRWLHWPTGGHNARPETFIITLLGY